MVDVIVSLFQPEALFAIFISLAAFATVLTVAAPYFESDNLGARIKAVSVERDKLRAQQKAMLASNANDVRLREKPKQGLVNQLVNVFNLRRMFETDGTRDLLKQAGYRNDNHVVTYLAIRLITPLIMGVLVFVYTSVFMSDKFSINVRIAMTMGGFVLGFYLPNVMLKNQIKRRQDSIRRSWSDALDLLLICVESGMAIEPAMQRVAKEIGNSSVPLAEELTLTVAELSYLQDRRKAFENLGKRTGMPTVRSVVTSLIQAERYGTPLGTALRVLAQENRDARMSEAERKAAALPPKLTVPMILFFLPVIFVVVLAPSAIMVMGIE
jgi:tight adherence protein C